MLYSSLAIAAFLLAPAEALKLPPTPMAKPSRRQAAAFLAAGLAAPALSSACLCCATHICGPLCACSHIAGGGIASKLFGATPAQATEFKFAGGLPDCVTTDPASYKVAAEVAGARLIEGTFAPGSIDTPHSHPAHSLYFVTDAKLAISDPAGAEFKTVEVPAGSAPIFPVGTHQVKNVGSKDVTVLFVEPLPTFKATGKLKGQSPFETDPEYYTKLAEDVNFVTGILSMPPGAEDKLHTHKDHLIYVLAGDEVTIYPGGDKAAGMAVPIKPGAGIPAPVNVPLFASHTLKNSGKGPLKLLFFEQKA